MPESTSPDPAPLAPPICPVGEQQCDLIDELVNLRGEVQQLSEQVRIDTLTGLYNFRHFRQHLELEMERTRRSKQATVLIMLDLDFFKKVNDNYGHEVGNQALVATAEALRNSTRRLDIPCRYGGEEFAIILPATDLMTGILVAERVRTVIDEMPVLVDGKDINLSASLGVDVYCHFHDDTPEQWVRRADESLYEAKQSGRNKVCHGHSEVRRSDAAVSVEEREALSDFFAETGDAD